MNNFYEYRFYHYKDWKDISYLVFLTQLLNARYIQEEDKNKFESYVLSNFKEDALLKLVLPNRGKKMNIPYGILGIFYARMYTLESLFYKQIGQDLINEKFNLYSPYILTLYHALRINTIQSYHEDVLYRGTFITDKEINNIEQQLNNEEKVFLSMKNFQSFSKDLFIAESFLCQNTEGNALLIVEGIKELNNFYISNLDIENFSNFSNEKEVLFLPWSSFEIVSIRTDSLCGKNFKEIRMKYLNEYKNKIDGYLNKVWNSTESENIRKKNFNHLIEKIFNSEIRLQVENDFSSKMKEQIDEEIKKYFLQHIPRKILQQFYFNPTYFSEKEFIKVDPEMKSIFPGHATGAQLNELFAKEPISYEPSCSIYNGITKCGALLTYEDETTSFVYYDKNQDKTFIMREYNYNHENTGGPKQKSYEKDAFVKGEKTNIKNVNTGEFVKDSDIKNMDMNAVSKDGKNFDKLKEKSFKRSNYDSGYFVGKIIGSNILDAKEIIENPKEYIKQISSDSAWGIGGNYLNSYIPYISYFPGGVRGIINSLSSLADYYNAYDNGLDTSEIFNSLGHDSINYLGNLAISSSLTLITKSVP